jgi:hypothetical protein
MERIFLFISLIFIVSCNNRGIQKKPTLSKQNAVVDSIYNEVYRIQNNIIHLGKDTSKSELENLYIEYSKSKTFEIRVALNLYQNKNSMPDESYENYLENKNLYIGLLSKMFFFDDKLALHMSQIENNSVQYQQELREIVFNTYNQYHSMNTKEFYTLLELKDTFLIKMFQLYLHDNLADTTNKAYILRTVKKSYPRLLDIK